MVQGQEPAVFQTSHLSGRVQRNLLSRFVNEEHQMGGVKLQMSVRNDSEVDTTQELILRVGMLQDIACMLCTDI